MRAYQQATLILRLAHRVFRERRWGEESIVFDTYSGETHYLNPLSSAVFRRVSVTGTVELVALCAELIKTDDAGSARVTLPEEIGSAAATLQNIGLISVDDSEP